MANISRKRSNEGGPSNAAKVAKQARRKGGNLASNPSLNENTSTPDATQVPVTTPRTVGGFEVEAPTRWTFVNPYSVSEVELIRNLYKTTKKIDLRQRAWTTQVRQANQHMHLFVSGTPTLDVTAQKDNAGGIIFTQHVLDKGEPAVLVLVTLKPKEPLQFSTASARVFILAVKAFDAAACQPESVREFLSKAWGVTEDPKRFHKVLHERALEQVKLFVTMQKSLRGPSLWLPGTEMAWRPPTSFRPGHRHHKVLVPSTHLMVVCQA